jgi:DNA invertase Pin-like site-specific DNA recombinase
MSELTVTAAHLQRAAVVYVRQSTLAQVDRNRESTARQYDLVAGAERLGWPRSAVRVIDEDLGVSGASTTGRSGFAELAAQVGLGQVGIVLSLECSRLARNNADWGTVQRTVFPARHAGLRSGEMRTVSDDIRRYESTQA